MYSRKLSVYIYIYECEATFKHAFQAVVVCQGHEQKPDVEDFNTNVNRLIYQHLLFVVVQHYYQSIDRVLVAQQLLMLALEAPPFAYPDNGVLPHVLHRLSVDYVVYQLKLVPFDIVLC